MSNKTLSTFIHNSNNPKCRNCRYFQKAMMLGVFCSNPKVCNKFPDHTFYLSDKIKQFSWLPRFKPDCEYFGLNYNCNSYPIDILKIINRLNNKEINISDIHEDYKVDNISIKVLENIISNISKSISDENWSIYYKLNDILKSMNDNGIDKLFNDLSDLQEVSTKTFREQKRNLKSGLISQREYQNLIKEARELKIKLQWDIEDVINKSISDNTYVEFPEWYTRIVYEEYLKGKDS